MAKRVNKKFLIIITVAVCAFAGVALALNLLVFRRDAQSYITAGDRHMESRQYVEAVESYRRALSRDQSNVEILTKLGDAYNEMAGEDAENLGRARQAWMGALTLEPRYVPALTRILDSRWDYLQIAPGAVDEYAATRETAGILLDSLPESAKKERLTASTRLHLATLLPWVRQNVPMSRQQIEQSIKAISALQEQDPANPELPLAITAAYTKRASEADTARDDATKSAMTAKAAAVMEEALKGQEKNAAMQLAAYQVNLTLAQLEKDEELRKPFIDRANAALDAAIAAASKEDPSYPDVMISAAGRAAQQGDREASRKIYDALLAEMPNDPRVRFLAARSMAVDAGERDAAMKLLSRPAGIEAGGGAKALANRHWNIEMLLELAKLRLQKAQTIQDPDARKAELEKLDRDFQRLRVTVNEDFTPFARLQARKLKVEGNLIGAIQEYARAAKIMGNPRTADDFDLLIELAQTYLETRPPQLGAARKLLEQIVDKFPKHAPTRVLLARIALEENYLEGAAQQINELEKIAPDSPELLGLRVTLLKKGNDPNAIDAYFAQMPEKTRDQRLLKSQVGGLLEKNIDAIRLARANFTADKKDLASVETLVRLLLAEKQNDQARQVVKEAIAANPENTRLKESLAQLDLSLEAQAKSSAERYEDAVARVTKELADKPLARAVALGDLARQANNAAEAEKQYKAAEKIDPADKAVVARLYDLFMVQGKLDEALPYHKALVKAKADGRNGLALEARFALAKNDVAGALKFGQDLTVRFPEFGDSWVLLGQAQQAAGRYGEALNQYAAARQRQGKSFEALKGIVECSYALNQPAEAGRAIDEGRTLFPDNPLFRELELRYEVAYGDAEKAIGPREAAHKERPDDPAAWLSLADAYLRTAQGKYAKDEAKSKPLLDKSRALLLAGVKKWPQDIRFRGALATLMLSSGDFEAGENLLKEFAASEKVKETPQPSLMLADYYSRAGKGDLLVQALRDALAKSKDSFDVRRQLVATLAQQRQFDEALKVIDAAPQDDALNSRLRIDVLTAAGRREEASRAITAAIEKYPAAARELRTLLMKSYIDQFELDKASEVINTALVADPKDAAAIYYRGLIKLNRPQRDTRGAIADMQAVLKVDPRNVSARMLMADAHLIAGARDRALAALSDILRDAPLNREVRKRLIDAHAEKREWESVIRLAQEAEQLAGLRGDPLWPQALAMALSSKNPPDYPKAIEAILRALQRTPQESNAGVAREYLSLLLRAGDFEKVLTLTSDFIKQKQGMWWVYQARGVARAEMKDLPAALGEFDRALAEADKVEDASAAEDVVATMASTVGTDVALERADARAKTDPRWRLVAAAIHRMRNDWPSAIREADGAIEALKDAKPAQRLAMLRAVAGIYHFAEPQPQVDKARKAYLQILELAPQDYLTLNNLAVLLAESANPPDPKAARQYSERAYDLVKDAQPINGLVVDTHGWILALNDDLDRALPLLKAVVDNRPFAEARFHLGVVYGRKQRRSEAEQQLAMAKQELEAAREAERPYDQRLLERIDEELLKLKASASSNEPSDR